MKLEVVEREHICLDLHFISSVVPKSVNGMDVFISG